MAVYRAKKRRKSNAKIWTLVLIVIAVLVAGALLLKNKIGKKDEKPGNPEKIPEQADVQNYIPEPMEKNNQGLHLFFFNPRGAADQENFYYIQNQSGGQFVWTINFETKQQRPLCVKPGCAHNDASCDAYVPGRKYSIKLTEWNGKLYLMDWPGDPENPGGIQEMNLDGSNRHYIHKFENGDMWGFENQIVSEDTLYINYYSVPNGDAAHTFVYHQGDEQAVEGPAMLKAGDHVITGIGDNILSLRRESLNYAGTNEFVLVNTNGEAAAWRAPSDYHADREHILNGKLYDVDEQTGHFKSIDLLTMEEKDYGKAAFETSGCWSIVEAKDGNVVLITETRRYYQVTQQGIKKSTAGYFAKDGFLRNMIDADAENGSYLVEEETDTECSNFKIISKNDFWNSKETGEPVCRME